MRSLDAEWKEMGSHRLEEPALQGRDWGSRNLTPIPPGWASEAGHVPEGLSPEQGPLEGAEEN